MLPPHDQIMQQWALRTNPWLAAYAAWVPLCNAWFDYNRAVMAAVYGPMLGAMLIGTHRGNHDSHGPK